MSNQASRGSSFAGASNDGFEDRSSLIDSDSLEAAGSQLSGLADFDDERGERLIARHVIDGDHVVLAHRPMQYIPMATETYGQFLALLGTRDCPPACLIPSSAQLVITT